jgi:RNA polymerase sigma-70 factor (ECF subfamily)
MSGSQFAERLLLELGVERGKDRETTARLQALLVALFQAAEQKWPQCSVSAVDFMPFLARRLNPDKPIEDALQLCVVEDLWLAYACLTGAPEAVAAFRALLQRIQTKVLSRWPLHESVRHEFLQHLLTLLLVGSAAQPPLLEQYSGLGKLSTWLRLVVARRSRRFLGVELRYVPFVEGLHDEVFFVDDELELGFVKSSYRAHFREAFRAAIAEALSAKQRNILRYYLDEELNIDQIGKIYNVNRSTVARWLVKIRTTLLRETRKRLADRLNLSPFEFEKILSIIRSRLHATFIDLLGQETTHGDGVP